MAMHTKYDAFLWNGTWELVEQPNDAKIMWNKWVYRIKLLLNKCLDNSKAWVVSKAYNQIEGIDFSETFNSMVKPTIKQLDINNAFFSGDLDYEAYISQPQCFVDPLWPYIIIIKSI